MPLRPDIRFCTTADNAKLAVGLYGDGPPLVRAGTWLTHVEYDATSPLSAHWCEELARRHRYVAYDSRGCGLSDRQVHELSLDLFVADPICTLWARSFEAPQQRYDPRCPAPAEVSRTP